MTDTLLTPVDVVRQLSKLGGELDAAVRTLKSAEIEAVEKRHEADMVESRAFLSGDGSMDLRKHQARVAADKFELGAMTAEAVVKHLRAHIRTIETRIEIGRSMGVALRSELKLLPYSETP